MTRSTGHLATFRLVDDLATEISDALSDGGASPLRFGIDSDCLPLGPLAETLVLKHELGRLGHSLVVSGKSDRDSLFRKALSARAGGVEFAGGLGVLRVVGPGQQAGQEQVNRFVLALGQVTRARAIPPDADKLLCHVAGELIDNVGEHAGMVPAAFAAFEVRPGECWLTVADTGRGALRAYREAGVPGGQIPIDAVQALEWAVLQHRSRTGDPGRGLGFRRLQEVLRRMDATIRIRSDDASLEVEGATTTAEWLSREQFSLSGFVVSAAVRW